MLYIDKPNPIHPPFLNCPGPKMERQDYACSTLDGPNVIRKMILLDLTRDDLYRRGIAAIDIDEWPGSGLEINVLKFAAPARAETVPPCTVCWATRRSALRPPGDCAAPGHSWDGLCPCTVCWDGSAFRSTAARRPERPKTKGPRWADTAAGDILSTCYASWGFKIYK